MKNPPCFLLCASLLIHTLSSLGDYHDSRITAWLVLYTQLPLYNGGNLIFLVSMELLSLYTVKEASVFQEANYEYFFNK